MVYKSKISKTLAAFTFGVTAISVLPTVFISFTWWDLLFAIGIFSFLIYTFTQTRYKTQGDVLEVRCGILPKSRYDIKEIRKISKCDSWESAPAISMDRIRITFSNGKYVIVSPKDKTGFINELVEKNKDIVIEGISPLFLNRELKLQSSLGEIVHSDGSTMQEHGILHNGEA